MTRRAVAKFYAQASAAPHGAGHVVLLDGKVLKTPGGCSLIVPSGELARAIAGEWQQQGSRVDPARMPLTGLAYTAIEGVPRNRGKAIEHILGFARSDLVCYRAASPPELLQRQSEVWDPILDWLADTHAIRLHVGEGIAYIEQPEAALLRLGEVVGAQNDFRLAALQKLAALTGSFVIAFAVLEGRLAPREAGAAAQLDELFQAEKWGHEPEAAARRDQIAAELEAAGRFARLSVAAEA